MKVTLDTCCIPTKENSSLDTIFKLANEGKIEIFFTDAFIADVLTGKKKISELSENQQQKASERLSKATNNAKEIRSFQTFKYPYNRFPLRFGGKKLIAELADILFPQRKEGGKYEDEDVHHIYAHYVENNDVFITSNRADFINGNRRQKLAEKGITVMTPTEFIAKWREE